MKRDNDSYRLSVIKKVCIVCLLLVVASCEDLTDSLSPRDNIIGTWKCAERDSGNGTDNFEVDIEKNILNATGIEMYNFNHLNLSVNATVSGSSISIPIQTVNGFKFSGSGSVNSSFDRITLSYSVEDGSGGKENYSAVLTPQ